MVEEIEKLGVHAQLYVFCQGEPTGEIQIAPDEIGATQSVAAEISELAVCGESPPAQAPVLGSTVETNAAGLSH